MAVTPIRDRTTDTGRGKSVSKCPRTRGHIDMGHRPEVPVGDVPYLPIGGRPSGPTDCRGRAISALSNPEFEPAQAVHFDALMPVSITPAKNVARP